MTSALETFRSEVRRVYGDRSRRGRRYSTNQKGLAVRHALERKAEGQRLAQSAAELGVPAMTLRRWMNSQASFRPVKVVEPRLTASYTVVTPEGFRVEGVGRDDLAIVIRLLR